MSSEHYREQFRRIFEALAVGDGRPFVDAMADEFTWTIRAVETPWARSWRGKRAVREQLLAPLFAQFATPYRNRAQRILVDGDTVVVLCTGDVVTQSGKPYCNEYCFVIRMRGAHMIELVEHLDTALVNSTLQAPPAVAA
ncbi:MAG: nuclear transport factor 2 family protein [Gammaproteobacteria bacterium]